MEQSLPAEEFDADNAHAPGIPPTGKPVELPRVAVMNLKTERSSIRSVSVSHILPSCLLDSSSRSA